MWVCQQEKLLYTSEVVCVCVCVREQQTDRGTDRQTLGKFVSPKLSTLLSNNDIGCVTLFGKGRKGQSSLGEQARAGVIKCVLHNAPPTEAALSHLCHSAKFTPNFISTQLRRNVAISGTHLGCACGFMYCFWAWQKSGLWFCWRFSVLLMLGFPSR